MTNRALQAIAPAALMFLCGAPHALAQTADAKQPVPLVLGDAAGNPEARGVTYQRWENVPGALIPRGEGRFSKLGDLDRSGLASSLEFPDDGRRNFEARIRGYIVAPRSATVKFVLASDDNSEFWLSPGEDSFARRQAAWVKGEGALGWTSPGETGRVASQWTAPVLLVAGRKYYFEALHKLGNGPGHFSLRWQFDGDKQPSIIPGECLRPWLGIGTDADDDGLPDRWQSDTGLSGHQHADAMGDADGDGVVNFNEFIAGTNPLDASPMAGMLLWEAWYGIPGKQVSELVRSGLLDTPADQSGFVQGASTPIMTAGSSGSRLSGFIVPEESGEYNLGVAGDDSTELWLSPDGTALNKDRIAFGTSWRPRGDWAIPLSQRSKPVMLEAGHPYYFEILQKDGGPSGWSAIGWKKANEEKFREIPASYLRSPGVPSEDADRDFLPDAWAARMGKPQGQVSAALTAHGDPDRDGVPNWLEARLDTGAMEKTRVMENLIREWWLDVPGRSLSRTRDAGVFLRPPSMVDLSPGAGSEAYTADAFASRFRGYVTAPASGIYRFWIAGDDQCELWLSGDGHKFRKSLVASVMPEKWEVPETSVWTKRQDWDARRGQQSADIGLVGGRSYFIEILLKDSGADDHVAVAWQHRAEGSQDWSARGLIESSSLLSYDGDEDDIDDDYLPDSWELQYGLDPQDNGSKDRAKQGEAGDFDGDRITNREEFLRGTNPCSQDSDGDGVGDYDEIKLYGSDPTARDASPPVKHADLRLSRYQSNSGTWSLTSSGSLYSMARRGAAEFSFDISEAGVYLVELRALAHGGSDYVPPVRVIAAVDGTTVGGGEVTSESTTLRWFTPWLAPGRHTVGIDNRNVRAGVALEITALSLYRHEGEDADANGIPDWMEKFFFRQNGVASSALSSAVSPLCLEGKSRFVGSTLVSYPGGEVKAQEGIADGWYADIPLNPSADMPVTVSYEGGAFRSSHNLTWTTTNLFESPASMKVRKGDSLKISATPPGANGTATTARITLDSVPVGEGTAGETQVVSFDRAGSFVLHAAAVSGTETLETTTTVEVVEADFGPTFSLAFGSARIWQLPGVPHDLAIEADPRLSLQEITPAKGGDRVVTARSLDPTPGSPRVLVRLEEGGPVVAATSVNAFRIIASSLSRDVRQIDVLPDGTRVLEFKLLIDGVIPADLSIWLEFYVTDALFADGTTRYHLSAADFDENGVARILVYKAPGEGVAEICHWIRPYDDAGPLPPEEEAGETETGRDSDSAAPAGELDLEQQ